MARTRITLRRNPIKKETCVFKFNDFDLNDVVLHLEILPNDSESSILPNDSESSSEGVKVKTLKISSHVVASKSIFFYKLLSNGKRESQQDNIDLSLTIKAQEEEALMNLLNFMYEYNLKVTSSTDLLNVLIAAKKFEVISCMKFCVDFLLKLYISRESALDYLNLPSCVLESEIVRPIIDASIRYFTKHFEEFTKSHEEAASKLPLSIVEMVLGSEGLSLVSEDDVFNFILGWARGSYPKLEERREIITKHLMRFICFLNLSTFRLKEALLIPDLNQELVSKLVLEALFFQAEHRQGHRIHTPKDLSITYRSFLGRVYSPRCEVYFDVTKDELKSIFPSQHISTHSFCLGRKSFYLFVRFWQHGEQHYLGLFVCKAKATQTGTMDCEFAVMNKSSMIFEVKWNAMKISSDLENSSQGPRNLLGITWTQLMSDDNDYFINDVLHLRTQITLNNSKT